jgi:hypothetical protein
VAVRDGLRSGDGYLPESRRHVSCANLLYDPTRWTKERDLAYPALALPQEPEDCVSRLQQACDAVARRVERGLSTNDFVTIRRDRLPLKRRDALELPPRILPLRRPIAGALPRVRIEDLLTQGDAWCDVTRVLRRPDARASRIPHFSTTLLAPLIAHGTH